MSDSILALNKFYSPVPASGFLIMSTYSFAQYFITKGIVNEQKTYSSRLGIDEKSIKP
ncbi:MAG: hypothetical protein IPL46_20530 [Saprospiraceae bacterium]|nr:hypothetical protein [Saprospiraceae bacterium]